MGKFIQMVCTSDENYLFIIDFENGELSFRISRQPNYLQKEVVKCQNDMVYTNLYNFHKSFLENFIKNN